MRIKRLEVMGFKSFPERVQVPFAPGISAVVGPNGCGKSNIVDAIRWVMGEQSPKQLRGRNMDDILFNGARSHQTAGMAEVTMLLSNEPEPGSLSRLGPSEISITRRLYRSGDSEYLINRVPCRLKDITQFFMDTGMGTKAYAIIEQGRIGAMVDSRPEERRALIDEAAGITRYKAQKKEAERKIEATEQNLTHISAVMAETKRQINTLTRAANKAARYKEYKAEMKQTDLGLTILELRQLAGRKAELVKRKEDLQAELTGLLTGLDRMEVDLEKARLDIVDREKSAEEKNAALYQLQNDYNTLKQEDEYQVRQIEANRQRRERLTEELERLAKQKNTQVGDLDQMREDMRVFRAETNEKESSRNDLRIEYKDLKDEYDLAASRQAQLQQEISDTRSRFARLEETLAGNERLAENHAARSEEIGTELESLRAEASGLAEESYTLKREREDLEDRIEDIRFQADEQRRVMESRREEAKTLIAEERRLESELSKSAARLGTLKDVQAKFGWYPEGVQALMSAPELKESGLIGPLADRINAPAGYEAALETALGDRLGYVVVKDRQAAAKALDFLRKNDLGRCGFISMADLPGQNDDLAKAIIGDYELAESIESALDIDPAKSVLTRNGEFIGADGTIIGGKPKKESPGLLARRREMQELENRVEGLEDEKERLEIRIREIQSSIEDMEESVKRFQEESRVSERQQVEVDKKLSALGARRGDLERRIGSLTKQLENQALETERLEAARESALIERENLENEGFDLNAELDEITERVAVLSRELEDAREKGEAASLEVNLLKERLATAEREFNRTQSWLEDIKRQSTEKQREMDEAAQAVEHLETRRKDIAESLSGFDGRLERARTEVSEAKRLLDELRARTNEIENETRAARRRREQANEAVQKVELDLQETGFQYQDHVNRIRNDYDLDVENLPESELPNLDDEFDVEEARKQRDILRKRIADMGEVNLTAIGEHDALMERYDFYKTQYEDLERSIANLRDSISKINRTCRIRFKSTFEAVDAKLREIFPLLFEGGEAWLSLTDENDILNSGVEIHVHPPGKRLTVMSLLSGGEKALVALALIFALYLIKPSPFCMLDETDAPLDEANIDRFNRLLKKLGQSSQIIMVTHNKRTMQISETLYGVTMEEPGVSKVVSVNLSDIDFLEDENAEMVQAG